ncbi:PAN domain-containing protein [Besnoitia besnoiti]|uniref:PAN domain-containing protein n=1 Tax=Besnoitia besnoiti TaxID=94643 RepID=A0A2A9MR09_BESBE|nr:PAN domain-containing protein [Besnoitia besnoiti]PFH38672.1 PAN domain-containing protein [Besnoitia besnoiti]
MLLADTVYGGPVLVSGETFSPYDCQIWCTDTDPCDFWTRQAGTAGGKRTCHLMTEEAFGTASRFVGAVSGPRGWCENQEPTDDAEVKTLEMHTQRRRSQNTRDT